MYLHKISSEISEIKLFENLRCDGYKIFAYIKFKMVPKPLSVI